MNTSESPMRMFENSNHAADAGGLAVILSKLLPPAVGASIMIAVDMPTTKRDWFVRIFVAFASSWLFGEVFFDFLDSFSLLSFLDPTKRAHTTAVDGLLGAIGFSVASGVAVIFKKFRSKPMETVDDLIERIDKARGKEAAE